MAGCPVRGLCSSRVTFDSCAFKAEHSGLSKLERKFWKFSVVLCQNATLTLSLAPPESAENDVLESNDDTFSSSPVGFIDKNCVTPRILELV